VNWCTSKPVGTVWLSMPTTMHCDPKRLASASISEGSDKAGELTEIFSAPAFNTSSASATLRMPPATQKGMSSTRATRETHARSTVRSSGLAVMS
jgi:hypothetical protein